MPVYFFWGDGCPHCAAEEPFLESLAQKYPQIIIQKFEVWNIEANQEILQKVAGIMGFEATGVPVTIIGEKYWVGYSEAKNEEMEAAITECIQNTCKFPIDPDNFNCPDFCITQKNSNWIIALPLIGNIDLSKQLFLVVGIGLALIVLLYFIYTKVFRRKQIQKVNISRKTNKKRRH